MPFRAIHQRVQERITRSKAASGYGRCCAAPAAKRTFRTPALRAFLFAAATAAGSGSIPSTLVANRATPSAKRPSPHPRSRTRFPRTSGEPPHSLSSSRGCGRRAEDSAGTCLPRSPTESFATLLICLWSLNLVGRARFELAVSWSQTRRFTELSYRPRLSIETESPDSAPDCSSARAAAARWLYLRFSSGGISPNVLPVPGTRKIGS